MTNDVRKILINNGLEEFIPILEENNLDREILAELTEKDYEKLGISSNEMYKIIRLCLPVRFSMYSTLTMQEIMQTNITAAKQQTENDFSKGSSYATLFAPLLWVT